VIPTWRRTALVLLTLGLLEAYGKAIQGKD